MQTNYMTLTAGEECRKAASILTYLTSNQIPQALISSFIGIAICSNATGVILVRLKDNNWSAPCAFKALFQTENLDTVIFFLTEQSILDLIRNIPIVLGNTHSFRKGTFGDDFIANETNVDAIVYNMRSTDHQFTQIELNGLELKEDRVRQSMWYGAGATGLGASWYDVLTNQISVDRSSVGNAIYVVLSMLGNRAAVKDNSVINFMDFGSLTSLNNSNSVQIKSLIDEIDFLYSEASSGPISTFQMLPPPKIRPRVEFNDYYDDDQRMAERLQEQEDFLSGIGSQISNLNDNEDERLARSVQEEEDLKIAKALVEREENERVALLLHHQQQKPQFQQQPIIYNQPSPTQPSGPLVAVYTDQPDRLTVSTYGKVDPNVVNVYSTNNQPLQYNQQQQFNYPYHYQLQYTSNSSVNQPQSNTFSPQSSFSKSGNNSKFHFKMHRNKNNIVIHDSKSSAQSFFVNIHRGSISNHFEKAIIYNEPTDNSTKKAIFEMHKINATTCHISTLEETKRSITCISKPLKNWLGKIGKKGVERVSFDGFNGRGFEWVRRGKLFLLSLRGDEKIVLAELRNAKMVGGELVELFVFDDGEKIVWTVIATAVVVVVEEEGDGNLDK